MNKKQKPLMLAYIIFLCICIVAHIVCMAFKLDFSMWQRIVAAATIASYLFSICSLPKLLVRLATGLVNDLQDDIAILSSIKIKLQTLENQNSDKCEIASIISDIDKEMESDNSMLTRNENLIPKFKNSVFFLDVLGYLAFFCIISFNYLFDFFAKSQELYTLLAFVILMVVEYLESTIAAYYSEKEKALKTTTKKLNVMLEEKMYGQTQDALTE